MARVREGMTIIQDRVNALVARTNRSPDGYHTIERLRGDSSLWNHPSVRTAIRAARQRRIDGFAAEGQGFSTETTRVIAALQRMPAHDLPTARRSLREGNQRAVRAEQRQIEYHNMAASTVHGLASVEASARSLRNHPARDVLMNAHELILRSSYPMERTQEDMLLNQVTALDRLIAIERDGPTGEVLRSARYQLVTAAEGAGAHLLLMRMRRDAILAQIEH